MNETRPLDQSPLPPLPQTSGPPSGPPTITPPIPWKFNSKTLLILAGLLLILLGGSAFAYVKYDAFKSPKTIYLESEAKNIDTLSADSEQYYTDLYNEFIKPYAENPYRSKIEASVKFTDFNSGNPQFAQFQKLLEKSKLFMDLSEDQKNQLFATKSTLSLNDSTLPETNVYLNKNSLYMGIPDISKKYFYLNLNDRENLEDNLEISTIPKRIVTQSDYINALKIPKEELNPILEEYAKLYVENLESSQFSLAKKDFVDDSYSTKVREITITFTDQQFITLTKNIADKMASDNKLHSLLATRIKNLATLLEDSGDETASLELRENDQATIKESFEEYRDDLKDELQDFRTTDGVKMILKIDEDDQIISREIMINDDGGNLTYLSTSYEDSNQRFTASYSLKFNTDSPQETADIQFTYHNTPSDNTPYNGDSNLSLNIQNTDKKINLSLDSKFNTKVDGNKKENKANYVLNYNKNSQPTKLSLDISSTISGDKKDKKRNLEQNMSLNINSIPDSPIRGAIALQIKRDEEFGIPVNIPTIESANILDFSDIHSTDFQQGFQEFLQSLNYFASTNSALKELLGEFQSPQTYGSPDTTETIDTSNTFNIEI